MTPRLGEIKVRLVRVTQYFTPIGFLASVLGAIKIYGGRGWDIFWLIPVFLFVAWFDHKRGFRHEMDYSNQHNTGHQELVAEVKKLREAVDQLRGN